MSHIASIDPLRPHDPFARLVAQPGFSIAHACLLIARDAYPGLDVPAYLARLDDLAAAVRARLPGDAFNEQRISALNAHLFGELGFRGNVAEYYDPRNSYLNDVLDRRTGIPITLSILYLEVGRRIGLDLQGVSFPGHFMVKVPHRHGLLVLDPFARGAAQSEADLRKRLAQALPPRADTALAPYLETASSREIVARVLRNLKAVHQKAGHLNELLAVLHRALAVVPGNPEDLRDRGLVHEALECFRPAAADLEAYLRRRPDAADGEAMREKLVRMQAAASRLN